MEAATYCSTITKTKCGNQGVSEEDNKSVAIKEIHYDLSKCNSPRSILDANSQFNESSSFSSEDSEATTLSEEDLSYFKELLSFALESPPSTKNPISNSHYGSGNHVHDDKSYSLFSSSGPFSPLMKSKPSGNSICNSCNSLADQASAMDSLQNDSLNCPTKIPSFGASYKCSDQSPQYPCPPLLFAAMENHLGYINNNNSYICPKPEISMKPPTFPIFPYPSYSALPFTYYEGNNIMSRPFNNLGIPPIWYSDPYIRPPLPFKVPFSQFKNVETHISQQLHYNLRNNKPKPGHSIEAFERELEELLKGRRKPIRISILPAMYEERFHKPINSSHDKLSALLSKCRNVLLVYRRGGQHVMMLKHDESLRPVLKVSRRTKRCLDPKSRKVYLTFPPGSTFTSDDAEAYFRQFGPIRRVRLSHEEPPTYAFVEFYTSEGALSALCNTKAHYISGQKVMVKPYRQSSTHKF